MALTPRLEDFKEDLRRYGPDALEALVWPQLVREDASRFMALAAWVKSGIERVAGPPFRFVSA